MAWLFVFIAGLLEISWAVGLKYTDGFTRVVPTVITVILMILSFVVLAQGVRTLPIGTSYAVWTGIGAAGTAIAGIILFNEPVNAWRVTFLLLIVVGIIGLKIHSSAPPVPPV